MPKATIAAMAFNLTRATGALVSPFHAKAETATIRAQLTSVPPHIARPARRIVLHLPRDRHWEHAFTQLFHHACQPHAPPAAA
ncbi:MAG TPA: hypothetical protein VK053_00435 [Jiangellaceae bacterium]|nr:hypothetical protein [Jiangellaceae bacterium]